MAQETVEVPITGKIISVNVKLGDEVKEGDVLCLLESMKMEIPVTAPKDGRLKEIMVEEGEALPEGETVAMIE